MQGTVNKKKGQYRKPTAPTKQTAGSPQHQNIPRNMVSQHNKGKNLSTRRVVAAFGRNAYSNTAGAYLARQMAIPDPSQPLARAPTADMPKVATTCLTSTHEMKTYPFTVVNRPPPYTTTSGDIVVLVYGQPGFSHMYGPIVSSFVTDTVTQTYHYSEASVAVDLMPLTKTTMRANTTLTKTWNPTYNSSLLQNTLKPIGLSSGRPYGWFDASEKFEFSFFQAATQPATLPVSFTIQIYRWQGPGEPATEIASMSYAKGGAVTNTLVVPVSGWYSFDFTLSATGTDTFTDLFYVKVQAQAAVDNPAYTALMYQEGVTNPDVGESVRRTAVSVLITNTSAEINKQGGVIAARLVNDGLYDDEFSFTTSHLTKAADKYTGQAANGCYTYMDFDLPSESFFQSHFGEAGRAAQGPCFNLEYFGYVHMIKLSNPSPTTSANDFLVTVTACYEFRTDSMLFDRSVAGLDFLSLIEARRINNSTPYFFENPLHFNDIWSHIKKAFSIVRRGAVPLGLAASAMFPEASGMIMPFAHAMQN